LRANDRVVVYGSLGLRKGISDLFWAFRKTNRMEEFPAYFDDHPFQVMERIRQERKHGMRTADVVIMPHYAVASMGTEGVLGGYLPAMARDLSPNMRASKEGAVPIGVTFMAMAYNTRALGKAELPKKLTDLTRSSWKGKLGTQSLTASRAGNLGVWFLSFLKRESTEEDWRSFVDSLGGSNVPIAYDCIDHLLQGLLDGDISLALTVYSLAYFREKSAGSPIALVDAVSIPHMMTFTSAALLAESSDRPSAKRFLDFVLTPAAQKIIGSIPGIAPVLPGAEPAYDFEHSWDQRTEFHPTVNDFREVVQSVALFQKLKLP
jgi:ABC-type Fe3+ transport system substrate-binding protein